MGTSTYDFEGTTGALPGNLSSGYATMTLSTAPAGTSSDFAVSATAAHLGSKSGKVTSSATTAIYYTATVASTTYLRGYFQIPLDAPTNSFTLGYLFGSGFAYSTFFGVTTDRRLYIARNASSTGGSGAAGDYRTAANAVPLTEWVRFEVALTATTGQIKAWTASGAGVDSTGTPDIDSGVVSGASLGALDQVAIGAYSSNSGTPRTFLGTNGLYLDDFAVSDAGWIGPAGVASAGTSYAGIVRI